MRASCNNQQALQQRELRDVSSAGN
jgi:hypothetical protein